MRNTSFSRGGGCSPIRWNTWWRIFRARAHCTTASSAGCPETARAPQASARDDHGRRLLRWRRFKQRSGALIFLVDASVYVFRAWHSVLPQICDRDGNPAHAVFGFARFLGDLIERVRPTYMAVAFDQRRAGSYRNRIYPPYKANRERAPADLALQFEHCREVCRRLGIAVFVDPDYEADDIIGTLAVL